MATEVDPRIPEKLYFKIGEVCDLIKVQPHVLRYWESEFPMLSPQKNQAGQRVYRRKDVEMVMRIRNLLYEEKFTIAGAKKRLADEMRKEPGPPKQLPAERRAEKPKEEHEVGQRIVIAGPGTSTQSGESTSRVSQRAIKDLKQQLKDLLTMLDSDASISR